MRAENLSVAAAFGLSYADLTAGQQRLFRRLGLAPGPDIDAHAAAALDGISVGTARDRLDELYDHHLITEPAAGRYLLHDLLREYAQRTGRRRGPRGFARRYHTAGELLRAHRRGRQQAHRHLDHGRRPAPARPPARQRAAAGHLAGRGRLAGGRAAQPARGGRLRRRGDAAGTPSPSPRRWAASCAPAVTGTRPRNSTRPRSARPAWPGTCPARPGRSTSSACCSS